MSKIVLALSVTLGWKRLKCYYDQNITSFFSSDFESVFALHLTGLILSFDFYPAAVYFECKFWSSITHG